VWEERGEGSGRREGEGQMRGEPPEVTVLHRKFLLCREQPA